MTLEDYLDTINANLELRRYCNQDRWTASFEYCEVRTGSCGLLGSYGNGLTIEAAIEDYISQIRGKRIIFNAMSDSRREFDVPKNLPGRFGFQASTPTAALEASPTKEKS